MVENKVLTTQRLVLRPLVREDAGAIYLFFSDEETLRYWNAIPHQSVEDTAEMIDHIISRERSCYWAISTLTAGTAIGYVGYAGNPGTPALVYILAPEYRGQGLATEAIRAAVGYGFDNLGLKQIEAWIHPENVDSIKAAGRVGFTYRGRRRIKFVNASVPHDLLVYGLEATEWLHVVGPLASSDGDQNFYGLRIVLTARNIEETIKFYQGRLGFELEYCHGDPPEEAGVSKGQWSSDVIKVHFVASEEEIQPLGYLYFIVGADIDGSDMGAVYVFEFNGSAWIEVAKLTASDGAAGDRFGEAVSLHGDRVVVGAVNANALAGAAYVFERQGATWNETAKLTAADGAANDHFAAVAVNDDWVLVGAKYNDHGGKSEVGAAYAFAFDGTTWDETKLVSIVPLSFGRARIILSLVGRQPEFSVEDGW